MQVFHPHIQPEIPLPGVAQIQRQILRRIGRISQIFYFYGGCGFVLAAKDSEQILEYCIRFFLDFCHRIFDRKRRCSELIGCQIIDLEIHIHRPCRIEPPRRIGYQAVVAEGKSAGIRSRNFIGRYNAAHIQPYLRKCRDLQRSFPPSEASFPGLLNKKGIVIGIWLHPKSNRAESHSLKPAHIPSDHAFPLLDDPVPVSIVQRHAIFVNRRRIGQVLQIFIRQRNPVETHGIRLLFPFEKSDIHMKRERVNIQPRMAVRTQRHIHCPPTLQGNLILNLHLVEWVLEPFWIQIGRPPHVPVLQRGRIGCQPPIVPRPVSVDIKMENHLRQSGRRIVEPGFVLDQILVDSSGTVGRISVANIDQPFVVQPVVERKSRREIEYAQFVGIVEPRAQSVIPVVRLGHH